MNTMTLRQETCVKIDGIIYMDHLYALPEGLGGSCCQPVNTKT